MTAPAALGAAPITAGDPTANLTAYVGGAPFSDVSIPCTPDAGQDHTVAQTTVTEDAPYVPDGVLYDCAYGGNDYEAYIDLESDLPASIDQGSGYNPAVDATVSWSDEAATVFRAIGLGVEDGSAGLNLTSTFGQGEQTSDIALTDTDVPAEGHVVWTGSGHYGVLDTSVPGEQTLSVGDGTITLNATVVYTPGVYTPATFDCAIASGEDTEIGTITVNETVGPVAVTGKVSIKGTAKVGKTLTAVPGKAAGAKIKYQWFANNKAIKKATAKKLKLTKSLKGKKVKVQATYSKNGSYDVVQTSKAVKVKK